MRCSATTGTSRRSAAASSTGTSLNSQGCRLMIWPFGNSCVTPGAKMPKCVRLSSAVSGPEWPATNTTLPSLRSQSCASWLNSLSMPYKR